MKPTLTQAGIAIVILGCTLALYGFSYAAISAKSAEVAGLENLITTKMETAKRIASARAALVEIAGEEAGIRNYFVSGDSVVAFIDNLEARGRAQRTSVTVLSVSTASDDAHPTLAMTLAIEGTFDAVMRTIGAIEYAPYDLRVTTVALGLTAKNGWHADLSLNVGSTASTTPH